MLPVAMSELQKQFDYYVANQEALVEQYNGRWVVIVDQAVVRDFETEIAAYEFASNAYRPGTFMIQRVSPGQENYSQTFYSRVGR